MGYISVAETAKKWRISERSVRNYASLGRIDGATLKGKTWLIPVDSEKPKRLNKLSKKPVTLLEILQDEKKSKIKGGIYQKIQIELTYNSNHIEGSQLTHDQTRYIYETNTIEINSTAVNVDDIVETTNHFKAIDIIIEQAKQLINEKLIKFLHQILKNGTSDSRKEWFAVGDYKKLSNEVGGRQTTLPEDVPGKIKNLIVNYNKDKIKTFEEIIEFHYSFEAIHPFQDGNGRVGRLILFKELLRNNIVPFLIDEELKIFYYRGLTEWENERRYLLDTCLMAQDKFKKYLDYFRIPYKD
jgi:Fic family protein